VPVQPAIDKGTDCKSDFTLLFGHLAKSNHIYCIKLVCICWL